MYGEVKIYVNPTRKELKEILDVSVRGFAAPNGNAYVVSDGIHSQLATILKNEISIKDSVPFIIYNKTRKTTKILFGDYINVTKYSEDWEGATQVLENNMWIKKMFPNALITGSPWL